MRLSRCGGLLALVLACSPCAGWTQANIDHTADRRPVERALERLFLLGGKGDLGSPEGKALRCGELDRAEVGGPWPFARWDTLVMLGPDHAVARVPAAPVPVGQALGPGSAAGPARPGGYPDAYLYLDARSPGGAWCLRAIRSLALPGYLYEMRGLLTALPHPTRQQSARLRNLNLTMASDADLKDWFAAHRSGLDRLRALKPAFARVDTEPGSATPVDEAETLLEMLGLNSVTTTDGQMDIDIGGILDNTVGFLHGGTGDAPPIDSSDHIWIEPMGDGWFLYRTT
ncbi:hypothetical protein BH10PSE12_BH10PSE12_35100 [soil metagenome]